MLKVAIGLDGSLFELCERQRERIVARDPESIAAIVERALRAKIRIVEADPLETGERRLLNLGHTLGHALEARASYGVPHGTAVARGLHHALALAAARELLAPGDAHRAGQLLASYGFVPGPLPPRDELLAFVRADKKAERGLVHAVLPDAIGSCRTVPMTPEEFLATVP